MIYRIHYRDRKGRSSILPETYPEPRSADHQIKRYIDCWSEPPSMVYLTSRQHTPGQSTAFFNNNREDYIQATRVGVFE